MTRLPDGSVTGRGEDGDLTVDAQVLAPRLGLSVAKLKAEMRRGIVYSRVERGEGADAGYWRITVTYRQHAVRVLVAPDGAAYHLPAPSPDTRVRSEPPLVALARRVGGQT
ncbi:hypothetical protein CKO28_19615 [Rhodovibrio sodomensis]|uniref:Uncharacterized protein n=1 Tax=Rhodovibrio sodomensis TaxID=1088 RepID=A0ABS1DJR8_9PROT|nr:DUF6522 family protein [Rhodovibrio sodomensis]MBK1670241.1 hypothetical protein [Rhodovibrio sodomensis]